MIAVVALASCAPAGSAGEGDAAASPRTGDVGTSYSAGILATESAKGSIRGVFPEVGPGSESCCWVGPDARFIVLANADAKRVRVTVYEPAIKQVSSSQMVSVIDGKGRVAASHRVVPGLQTITLPLPRDVLSAGTAYVHLRMSRSFVPRETGMNGDPRRLALILRDVATE